jgi:hypothetical protein
VPAGAAPVETPVSVTTVQSRGSLNDTTYSALPAQALAKRIVDLVTEGSSVDEATAAAGIVPSTLSPDVRRQIKELLTSGYHVPADIQRAVLRAGRFKIFMQTQEAGLQPEVDADGNIISSINTGALKMALEASKQIAMDPEIGLTQAPQTVVNIDITALKDVLQNVEALPGLEEEESMVEEEEEEEEEEGQVV